jgi:hypothetical protein
VTDVDCPSVSVAVTTTVCDPTEPANAVPLATGGPPSIDAEHPSVPDFNAPLAPGLQEKSEFGTDPDV